MSSTATTPSSFCSRYAPGVSRLIAQSQLSDGEKEELLLGLEESLQISLEHSWVPRELGVSYNPLPARLVEILLREAKVLDFSELMLALRLSTSPAPVVENSPAYLAYGLDIARHLHRGVQSEKEKTGMLGTLSEVLPELAAEKPASRLVTLYCTAVERAEKNLRRS